MNLLQDDDQVPTFDQNKDYLTELVGEGKKFKTPEDLARGKFEADQYIEIMKRRQDEMRADYIKMRDENMAKEKLEELIDRMSTQRQSSNNIPIVKEEDKPVYDPKQVDVLISNKLQEFEVNKKQTENTNLVMDTLKQHFGNNYRTTVKEQISQIGLSEDEFNDMARRNPKVLFRALGIDQTQRQDTFQAPPRSNQRSDNFSPKGGEKRTWTYYQNLKKANPDAWRDRKTAIQMQQDAIELGEAFKDGDYDA